MTPETYEALVAARKDAKRRVDAVHGNEDLSGCEEFYRGYNAVVRHESAKAGELISVLDAALAKVVRQ